MGTDYMEILEQQFGYSSEEVLQEIEKIKEKITSNEPEKVLRKQKK